MGAALRQAEARGLSAGAVRRARQLKVAVEDARHYPSRRLADARARPPQAGDTQLESAPVAVKGEKQANHDELFVACSFFI